MSSAGPNSRFQTAQSGSTEEENVQASTCILSTLLVLDSSDVPPSAAPQTVVYRTTFTIGLEWFVSGTPFNWSGTVTRAGNRVTVQFDPILLVPPTIPGFEIIGTLITDPNLNRYLSGQVSGDGATAKTAALTLTNLGQTVDMFEFTMTAGGFTSLNGFFVTGFGGGIILTGAGPQWQTPPLIFDFIVNSDFSTMIDADIVNY